MLGCPCHSSQVPTNSPEPTPIPNLEDRASHQKSQNWKEIAQLHFRVAWNLWPLDFFQFTPLDMGMYILGLSYHYALEADNLLSGFTGSLLLLFSGSVMSNALQPHGMQHARLPCPSLCHGVCSNTCPLSWWCHPTISTSVTLFSSCLKLFQHQGLFQWVGSLHSMAKVLELRLQHQSFQWRTRFPLGFTGLISLLSMGLLRVFSSTTVWKHQFFSTQLSL